jgi:hypothetical protein
MEHIERLAIIGLLNLLVYYKSLFYGYVGDDVERSERPQEFKNRYHRWWIQFIGLKHRNSMVSHFITLITHTICCMMIYVGLGMTPVSFLAALLFSINPANIQGSVWISGRNYVTSTILILGMLALPKLSWFFYFATCYFAVNAWFAPLVFLGTPNWYWIGIIPLAWIIHPNNRATIHRKLWETGGLKTTNTEMRAIKWQKFIPFVKTYMYYLSIAIIPFHICIEHNYLRGFGTNKTDNKIGYKIDKFFYIGASMFIGSLVLSIMGIIKGWTPLSWGIFWFMVNISMWGNFVTYQQHISERYLYLANVGVMYALASVIINYPILISAFLIGYFVRLYYVMDMYKNDYWAVEYSIMELKDMHYMWVMRGVKKFMIRDYVGSLYDFNEAYQHKPYDLKVLVNLSTINLILGNTDMAKKFLADARVNVYDELDEVTKPVFDNLENHINMVEESRKSGAKEINIDLSKIMIIK